MFIANPIYDSVFKFLMEDTEIAIRLLSLLLEEEIIYLELRPQERTVTSAKHFFTVLRMDFVAIIRMKTGEEKKVLIELQKGKKLIDVMRFRRYLGENYSKPDIINDEKVPLPIITVYILGFKLSIEKAILRIFHRYQDMETKELLTDKDPFIEQLVHDSYVVQVPFLPQKAQTRLEKVLSVFRQDYIYDNTQKSILQFPLANWEQEPDLDLRMVLKRLFFAIQDQEVQNQIIMEEDMDESFDAMIRQKDNMIQEKELLIVEKELLIVEKELLIVEKEKEAVEERRQKEAAEEKAKAVEAEKGILMQQQKEAAKKMIEIGMTPENIAALFGVRSCQ